MFKAAPALKALFCHTGISDNIGTRNFAEIAFQILTFESCRCEVAIERPGVLSDVLRSEARHSRHLQQRGRQPVL